MGDLDGRALGGRPRSRGADLALRELRGRVGIRDDARGSALGSRQGHGGDPGVVPAGHVTCRRAHASQLHQHLRLLLGLSPERIDQTLQRLRGLRRSPLGRLELREPPQAVGVHRVEGEDGLQAETRARRIAERLAVELSQAQVRVGQRGRILAALDDARPARGCVGVASRLGLEPSERGQGSDVLWILRQGSPQRAQRRYPIVQRLRLGAPDAQPEVATVRAHLGRGRRAGEQLDLAIGSQRQQQIHGVGGVLGVRIEGQRTIEVRGAALQIVQLESTQRRALEPQGRRASFVFDSAGEAPRGLCVRRGCAQIRGRAIGTPGRAQRACIQLERAPEVLECSADVSARLVQLGHAHPGLGREGRGQHRAQPLHGALHGHVVGLRQRQPRQRVQRVGVSRLKAQERLPGRARRGFVVSAPRLHLGQFPQCHGPGVGLGEHARERRERARQAPEIAHATLEFGLGQQRADVSRALGQSGRQRLDRAFLLARLARQVTCHGHRRFGPRRVVRGGGGPRRLAQAG